jgi:hypothetical protein
MRLKSNALQKEFEQDGAVVIPKFINPKKLIEIQQLYEEYGVKDLTTIHSNILDGKPEFNHKLKHSCIELFKESINANFENHCISGGAFLLKGIGESSFSSLHQDWTLVDESKYTSASIFCPVEDVTLENGCLQILKGSHKWFKNVARSINIPSLFIEFSQIEKGLKAMPVKAGEAVLFDHKVFHGSLPNFTNKTRVAVAIGINTAGAELFHLIRKENKVHKIATNDDFVQFGISKLINNEKYDYEKIEELNFEELNVIDEKAFFKAYNKNNRTPAVTKLISKLFG